MKTILVVYTNEKLTKKEYVSLKPYFFNTFANLKVGDLVRSPDYDADMQVVEVLDKAYKYVNLADDKLSDKRYSTRQFELRELKIATPSKSDNVVVAEIIKD